MFNKTLFLLLALAPPLCAGELMVHPTRVVFDANTRTAQLDVVNSGTETMTYRISIVRRRMTATGDFTSVEQPQADERFSDDMIRYSPRQVILPPGAAQAVRLQLRKPPDLEIGEYRSHLLFQALPPAESASPDARRVADGDLDIRLAAIYSISIPLIVRHGATSAAVTIRDIALRDSAVSFTLDRTGTRSVYGDIVVSVLGPQGRERVIARANGVAVYTPNRSRKVRLPIPAEGSLRSTEQLRIAFIERREQNGRIESLSTLVMP